jgi:hypothetical protein
VAENSWAHHGPRHVWFGIHAGFSLLTLSFVSNYMGDVFTSVVNYYLLSLAFIVTLLTESYLRIALHERPCPL